MWVVVILLVLVLAYLLWSLRRLRKPAPVKRSAKFPEHALPIVRRSYMNGPERLGEATEPISTGRDVTFAGQPSAADETADTVPAWEGLVFGPVCVLGPENEDGSPNEILIPPPEPASAKIVEEDSWKPVDDYPDEEEPSVGDMTEEEARAVASFDVAAFR